MITERDSCRSSYWLSLFESFQLDVERRIGRRLLPLRRHGLLLSSRSHIASSTIDASANGLVRHHLHIVPPPVDSRPLVEGGPLLPSTLRPRSAGAHREGRMRLDGREVGRDEYRVDATAVAAAPTCSVSRSIPVVAVPRRHPRCCCCCDFSKERRRLPRLAVAQRRQRRVGRQRAVTGGPIQPGWVAGRRVDACAWVW